MSTFQNKLCAAAIFVFLVSSRTGQAAEQQADQPLSGIFPANGTLLSETDIKKAITFQWTPVIPRPTGAKYRLKVWQLMQGQNTTQAMRSNQPLLDKNIESTRTVISNLDSEPCKPPYLCDFIWNVQALNREGKPIGENNGTSEILRFKVISGKNQ